MLRGGLRLSRGGLILGEIIASVSQLTVGEQKFRVTPYHLFQRRHRNLEVIASTFGRALEERLSMMNTQAELVSRQIVGRVVGDVESSDAENFAHMPTAIFRAMTLGKARASASGHSYLVLQG